jgi:hypothetical protein
MPALQGIHVRVAVGHADDRLFEVAVAEADRAQHGAVGRAGNTMGDQLGTTVVGSHGGRFCARRQRPSNAIASGL